MELKPRYGMDALLFGMKQADVEQRYGRPDRRFEDEDHHVIYVYFEKQLRLTFYEDEDLRLGYLITANPEALLFGKPVIGQRTTEVKKNLEGSNISAWEHETVDITENDFNESNWIILQSEFGRVVKVELGAIIKDQDNFDWKFK